jgi:hypothetical protein
VVETNGPKVQTVIAVGVRGGIVGGHAGGEAASIKAGGAARRA